MTKKRIIQIKAAFLVLVFGMNPVIGFACSIGIDMGFNSKHHENSEQTELVIHIHKDGQKHTHYETKKGHHNLHSHIVNKQAFSVEQKENCCIDQVQQFEGLDKSLPYALNIVHPIFSITFVDAYYNVSLPSLDIVKNIKQFVRSYHPPIPDIRVAVQSFQI